MSALKAGATGRYVDADQNEHAVLVVCNHFEVKSPGPDDNGNPKPVACVEVPGKVRAKLVRSDGAESFAVIDASKVEV